MVDRQARDQMAKVLRAYMAEEILAFEFDKQTSQIMESTQDKIVRELWFILYGCFDDLKNHKVVADRKTWQYFHRILLVLESDGEYQKRYSDWYWNWDQILCAALLATLALLLVLVRDVEWIFLVLVFNTFSIPLVAWISRRRNARDIQRSKWKLQSAPFSSFGNLRYWRKRMVTFKRMPLTPEIEKRKIRSTFLQNVWLRLSMTLFYLFFSPLMLLFYSFPQRDTRTEIMEAIGQAWEK